MNEYSPADNQPTQLVDGANLAFHEGSVERLSLLDARVLADIAKKAAEAQLEVLLPRDRALRIGQNVLNQRRAERSGAPFIPHQMN